MVKKACRKRIIVGLLFSNKQSVKASIATLPASAGKQHVLYQISSFQSVLLTRSMLVICFF